MGAGAALGLPGAARAGLGGSAGFPPTFGLQTRGLGSVGQTGRGPAPPCGGSGGWGCIFWLEQATGAASARAPGSPCPHSPPLAPASALRWALAACTAGWEAHVGSCGHGQPGWEAGSGSVASFQDQALCPAPAALPRVPGPGPHTHLQGASEQFLWCRGFCGERAALAPGIAIGKAGGCLPLHKPWSRRWQPARTKPSRASFVMPAAEGQELLALPLSLPQKTERFLHCQELGGSRGRTPLQGHHCSPLERNPCPGALAASGRSAGRRGGPGMAQLWVQALSCLMPRLPQQCLGSGAVAAQACTGLCCFSADGTEQRAVTRLKPPGVTAPRGSPGMALLPLAELSPLFAHAQVLWARS